MSYYDLQNDDGTTEEVTELTESSFVDAANVLDAKEVLTVPMMITVQSLSTKAAVGMVAEDNFNGSVGPVYVFSAAQKYRLVLDIDLSELLPAYLAARAAAGSSSAANVFDGELSLQLDFSHTSRKKPADDTEGNWECFLSRVETLIEQESRDPEYPDLKKFLHVNDFDSVPIQLVDGKVKIVTRVWPCLFSGSKRRTKQEDHENIHYTVHFKANGSKHTLQSSASVQVCVVPKSSYYKRKQKKEKKPRASPSSSPAPPPARVRSSSAVKSEPSATSSSTSSSSSSNSSAASDHVTSSAPKTKGGTKRPRASPARSSPANGNGSSKGKNGDHHHEPMGPVSAAAQAAPLISLNSFPNHRSRSSRSRSREPEELHHAPPLPVKKRLTPPGVPPQSVIPAAVTSQTAQIHASSSMGSSLSSSSSSSMVSSSSSSSHSNGLAVMAAAASLAIGTTNSDNGLAPPSARKKARQPVVKTEIHTSSVASMASSIASSSSTTVNNKNPINQQSNTKDSKTATRTVTRARGAAAAAAQAAQDRATAAAAAAAAASVIQPPPPTLLARTTRGQRHIPPPPPTPPAPPPQSPSNPASPTPMPSPISLPPPSPSSLLAMGSPMVGPSILSESPFTMSIGGRVNDEPAPSPTPLSLSVGEMGPTTPLFAAPPSPTSSTATGTSSASGTSDESTHGGTNTNHLSFVSPRLPAGAGGSFPPISPAYLAPPSPAPYLAPPSPAPSSSYFAPPSPLLTYVTTPASPAPDAGLTPSLNHTNSSGTTNNTNSTSNNSGNNNSSNNPAPVLLTATPAAVRPRRW